ncbi:DNA-3-methyladenine glycosylase family protein [Leptospira kirschneri]|uniref:DNA-3-methyladenine glycosylase II n=1 Tax=Leptospira kirschneri str. 200802841 TaxID=1193047 RepID=A0A828XX86_9LEPT|nr:DNA-3-methyladenine glycosylase [Leptospira kirschneri]EMO75508.1 base excision DNA repair protein, HhH-GPD family [Leptospira kirschneri str. 200801925]EJO68816.1 base excision DNA repair protein, HhH-GPD family [Leptospira kirschneri serovar Grippotyphosa str. RM52]EKO49980.1 base excision DNA repair protein, HhH-GPD family [Leptospira kirschneri str. 200802841]EKQ85120.1 base excision DNA repair protein, HhH-GPD family [Leptospira kirschneri serovar Grippotyphosa str. Moskva]EKR06518.1 b
MSSINSFQPTNLKKRSSNVLESREVRLKKASNWLRKKDPITKKLVDSIGPCKLKTIGTPYQVLIKSVLGQQLSVKVALTFERRLISLAGSKKIPSPEQILKIPNDEMRKIGVSQAKTETIKRIAEAYLKRSITDSKLRKLEDSDVLKLLCSIKGVGPWTAEMVLIFALDRWDHFSINDLILRKSVEKHYGISKDNKKEIQLLLNTYSPYRTIISWYLWADIDGGEGWG